MPGIGSRLVRERSCIPKLRAVRVHGYQYHWYYLVSGDALDVLRLLPDMGDLAGIIAREAYDDDEQRR